MIWKTYFTDAIWTWQLNHTCVIYLSIQNSETCYKFYLTYFLILLKCFVYKYLTSQQELLCHTKNNVSTETRLYNLHNATQSSRTIITVLTNATCQLTHKTVTAICIYAFQPHFQKRGTVYCSFFSSFCIPCTVGNKCLHVASPFHGNSHGRRAIIANASKKYYSLESKHNAAVRKKLKGIRKAVWRRSGRCTSA